MSKNLIVSETTVALSIDTSTDYLSVAVGSGLTILGKRHFAAARDHMARLLPTIDGLLTETGLSMKDIEVVVVGTGPGSFTGLRIGVATARGLAHALGNYIIGIPSMDAIAYGIRSDGRYGSEAVVCPVVDAKRQEVYANFYRNGEKDGVFQVIDSTDLVAVLSRVDKEIILAGDGLDAYASLIKSSLGKKITVTAKDKWYPKAEDLIRLAVKKKAILEVSKIEPIYVRLSQAEENLKRRKRLQKYK